MTNRIRTVKKKLDDAISQLCEVSWMFTNNPEKDFTRSRKLSFRKVISFLLSMECPIRFNGLPVSDERCGQFG